MQNDHKRRHFDELIESVDDYAIFTLDRVGNILDWNQGARRLKGYTAEEIVGKHFSIFYPEDLKLAGYPAEELENAAAKGKHLDEGWRYRKDGSRFWASVTITAIRSEKAEVEGFLKITRDLTERQKATETLRQSEERFRLLLESVKDHAIFMLDPEGHVVSWNAGARRIKGYEESEIIGKHFSRFYTADAQAKDVPLTFLRRALNNGTAQEDGWRVRKDGSLFWGHVNITALYDATGCLRGFAKITRDLSDLRETQDLIESSRRKDVFLATLAHELRNPLAPMLPALDLIMHSAGDNKTVANLAGTLKRQVDQMSHLINDLLEVSRVNTGKIVLKNTRSLLGDIVERAVESVLPAIESRRHQLTVSIPESPMEIHGDPHRISQIISNLLSNAAKYTETGGCITLTATAENSNDLVVSVKDNGRGIPLDRQESIFELFDQGTHGSDDGLGIGLTLVKNLAEMHGGSVSVQSEGDGRGSDFIFRLPVLTSAPPQDSFTKSEASANIEKTPLPLPTLEPKKIKVLVVDDSENAANIVAMFFEMEGCDTKVAYDGLDALHLVQSFLPDLVIMDLGMPRMNGYEAAGHMKKVSPGTLIVALSGWGSDQDRQRSVSSGFDLHMVKPVVPTDLRALLDTHFRQIA